MRGFRQTPPAPGKAVTIRYFGEAVAATVATDPMFDPEMTRLRG